MDSEPVWLNISNRNAGKYLENLVYMALRRQGLDLYYYKTQSGHEVDFVIRKGRKIHQLIQVCDSFGDQTTERREISALQIAMVETNINTSLVLTMDTEDQIKIDNKTIDILPVYKWLLLQDREI